MFMSFIQKIKDLFNPPEKNPDILTLSFPVPRHRYNLLNRYVGAAIKNYLDRMQEGEMYQYHPISVDDELSTIVLYKVSLQELSDYRVGKPAASEFLQSRQQLLTELDREMLPTIRKIINSKR
jgi:hypothetical protein